VVSIPGTLAHVVPQIVRLVAGQTRRYNLAMSAIGLIDSRSYWAGECPSVTMREKHERSARTRGSDCGLVPRRNKLLPLTTRV
jgi:hypothetical protein